MPYWGTKSRAATIKKHPLKFGRSHKNGYENVRLGLITLSPVWEKKLPVTKIRQQ